MNTTAAYREEIKYKEQVESMINNSVKCIVENISFIDNYTLYHEEIERKLLKAGYTLKEIAALESWEDCTELDKAEAYYSFWNKDNYLFIGNIGELEFSTDGLEIGFHEWIKKEYCVLEKYFYICCNAVILPILKKEDK